MNKGFIRPEDQEPDIAGFEFYFDAFYELGTTRQFGMGIGPIPFTAVAEYFRIYSIDGDFEEFSLLIRHMDNVFLEIEANESKKSQSKKEGTSSGSSNRDKKNHSKS